MRLGGGGGWFGYFVKGKYKVLGYCLYVWLSILVVVWVENGSGIVFVDFFMVLKFD